MTTSPGGPHPRKSVLSSGLRSSSADEGRAALELPTNFSQHEGGGSADQGANAGGEILAASLEVGVLVEAGSGRGQ